MTNPTPKPRWYHLTPDRLFIGLLAVQVFLFLSDQFNWFPFNEKKGWTVLIAVGVVGVAVLVMALWGLVCLCLQRRFQFSFRSLLVFVVVVSVPLGWFAWEVERARRQREVVQRIEAIGWGVIVEYDFQMDEDGNWVEEKPTAPVVLRDWLGDDFFCDVVKVSCAVPYRHPGRRTLPFADDDLIHLEVLSSLRHLDLGYTEITDDGLGRLDGMTNLECLSLDGNQVSDTGLEYLKRLTNLKRLRIVRTQVSDEGVENLEEALPNCIIRR